MCACPCVYTHSMHMHAYPWVLACGGQVTMLAVILQAPSILFVKIGFLTSLGLTDEASMASQGVSRVHLPQLDFPHVFWGLTPGPHAYMTNTLPNNWVQVPFLCC